MAEERISELENKSVETFKFEKEREKKTRKWIRISKNSGTTTTDVIYPSWEYQREKKRKQNIQNIMTENFPLNHPFIRRKEGNYIMIKGQFSRKTTIFNVYLSNNRASNYTEQKLIELQGELDISIIIYRGFDIPLSKVDRLSKQKILIVRT